MLTIISLESPKLKIETIKVKAKTRLNEPLHSKP